MRIENGKDILSKRGWTHSPYDLDFYEHIDESMLPIIKALVKKGYLPYSCCEGHDWAAKRFFTVAFGSRKEAKLFSLQFLGYLPRIKKYGDDSNINFIDNKEGNTAGIIERSKNDSVGFLNYVYRRNYKAWYLVEVPLLDWYFGKFNLLRYAKYKLNINNNEKVLKLIDELEPYVY